MCPTLYMLLDAWKMRSLKGEVCVVNRVPTEAFQ